MFDLALRLFIFALAVATFPAGAVAFSTIPLPSCPDIVAPVEPRDSGDA